MTESINIVHLSDLHCCQQDKIDIQQRLQALFSNIEYELDNNISAIIISGDIAFSGKPEEYLLAQELIFKKAINRFHIPRRNIIIIPGNHDVDRQSIDPIQETGLIGTLRDTKTASTFLASHPELLSRLNNYYAFVKDYFKHEKQTFRTTILNVKGANIGFACLNSCWCSSNDKDQGKLFLTDWQINQSLIQLKDCSIRIAIVHHPLAYFHKSENESALNDLKRGFEIVLTGHLHEPSSLHEECPNHDSIVFSAPAIYSKYDNIGYNIYQIDFEQREITAKFRKYVRARNKFVPNVEYADDGITKFNLPTRNVAIFSKTVLCQKLTSSNEYLQNAVTKQLALYQESDKPIFVSPPLKAVTIHHGATRAEVFNGNSNDIVKQSSIIFGTKQFGKTILLETIVVNHNKLALESNSIKFAIYIDLDYKVVKMEELKLIVKESLKKYPMPDNTPNLVLCIDHLEEKDITQYYIIDQLTKEKNWKTVISCSNEILFQSILSDPQFSSYHYYKLAAWGPSRIRVFVKLFCSDRGIDPDAAYQSILTTLRNCDLPASPVIIALFLYAFSILGGQLSSLSFLDVLSKIEKYKLEKGNLLPQHSLYYKRRILMLLAAICRERDTMSLPLQEANSLVLKYFSDKSLAIDVEAFIRDLIDSGFTCIAEDQFAFTQYIFLDYYVAMACKEGTEQLETLLLDLSTTVAWSDSLSLYCAMNREQPDLPSILFGLMSPYFRDAQGITLNDLDDYIKDLLAPLDKTSSALSETKKALSEKVDYSALDEEFEKDRSDTAERRKYFKYLKNPASPIDILALKILALKTFYNVYRNLEELNSASKLSYLDKVLTHHIDCNMDLIKFATQFNKNADFKTLVGYMTTIGGQSFLTANLGSQSLEITIRDSIKQTTNDFKKLLLVCLYADLRLPSYTKYLKEYIDATSSMAAIEIIYLKIKDLIIFHQTIEIPTGLITVFQLAFKKRQTMSGIKSRPGLLGNALYRDLQELKNWHNLNIAAKV